MSINPYPFPNSEEKETPVGFKSPENWWVGLDPPQQKKEWAPVLRLMTPAQRAEFHAERRAISQALGDERSRFYKQESISERDKLYVKWSRIVKQKSEDSVPC